jgi:hypothetical protein
MNASIAISKAVIADRAVLSSFNTVYERTRDEYLFSSRHVFGGKKTGSGYFGGKDL